MKSFVITFFLIFISSFTSATSEEDLYVFLPFLRNYEPPPPCPPNELYKTCTGKCSDCTMRGKCIVTTCVKDCDCAPHFFRVTPDGPCEPVANCPIPECGENEVFRECGPVCERCTAIKCRVINCEHKCYCKEGYLRNVEGICIPAEQCPPKLHCSLNEEWAESGPVDEYCLQGNSTVANETQNVPQCYCKEGYKRNSLGHCMSEHFCPIIRCLGSEVYHDCIPKCNTTCRNYGDTNCTEDENCFPGCFCPPGYLMNDFRSCIPVENCTLEISQVKVVYSSAMAADDDDDSDESERPTESSTESFEDYTSMNYTAATTEHAENGEVVEEEKAKGPEDTSLPSSSEKSESETTVTPVLVTSENVKSQKRKDQEKMKVANSRSQKHANAAATSKTSKQETTKTDDLDNE